jgi:hypothetical protein
MAIRDKNTEWLEKVVYMPMTTMQSQVSGAFIGDGTPVFAEISSFDYTGVLLAATGTGVNHIMRVPYDLDRSKAIRFRVWWTINVTDGDVETPTLVYNAQSAGTVGVDAATALDTPIPAYTFNGTANALEVTGYGVIKKNTLVAGNASTAGTEFLTLKLTVTFNTASNSEISLLGLEMRYTPRRTGGPEKNIRAGRRLVDGAPLSTVLNTTQEGQAGTA